MMSRLYSRGLESPSELERFSRVGLTSRLGSLRDIDREPRLGSVRDKAPAPRLGSLRDIDLEPRLGSLRDIDFESRLGSARDNAPVSRLGSVRDNAPASRPVSVWDNARPSYLGSLRDDAPALGLGSVSDNAPASRLDSLRDKMPMRDIYTRRDEIRLSQSSRRADAPEVVLGSRKDDGLASRYRSEAPVPLAFRRDQTHVSLLGSERDELSRFHSRSVLDDDLYSRGGRHDSKRGIDYEGRGSESDYRRTEDAYERPGESRPTITKKRRSRFSQVDQHSSDGLHEEIIQSKKKSQDDSTSHGYPQQKHHKWAGSKQPDRAIIDQLRSEKEQQVKLEIMQLDEMKRQKEQELLHELYMMESFKERKHEEIQRQVMEEEMVQRDMLMQRMAGANAGDPNMNNHQHLRMMNAHRAFRGRGRRPFMHQGRGRIPPFGPVSQQMEFNASTMQRGNQTRGRPFMRRGSHAFGPHFKQVANFKSKQQNTMTKGNTTLQAGGKKNSKRRSQKLKNPQNKLIANQGGQTKRANFGTSRKLKRELGVAHRGKLGWRFAFALPEKVWTCYACDVNTETEENHAEHLETAAHEEALAQTVKKARLKLLQLQRNFMNEHQKRQVYGKVVLLTADTTPNSSKFSAKDVWIFKDYVCKICGINCCTSTKYIKHNLSVAHIKKMKTFIATDVKLKSGTLEYPEEYNPEASCGEDLVWVQRRRRCEACNVTIMGHEHFESEEHFKVYKALLEKEDKSEDDKNEDEVENAKNSEEKANSE